LREAYKAENAIDLEKARPLSVKRELQADCLAGVWANRFRRLINVDSASIKAAIETAAALGDDRLQRKAFGIVVPETFTHGSSEQRANWLAAGMKSGQIRDCDTLRICSHKSDCEPD
jgi:predicted metalloprotease